MDFEALHSANFKLLDDRVTDWTSMLTKLKELEKDAREGLRGRALKANWAGYNATVSREFIGKTAGEFADAQTQATSIRDITSDTRDELKTQQRLLREAIERGRGKHLTVTAKGGGFTVEENPDSKDSTTSQKDVDELRNELQRILDKATEIDSTAATSLKALVDLTDHGFSDAVYKDRDSAAAAVKKADRLAALAKKDPEDLTVKEFDELNAGLKEYANDDLFAERFATSLKAKGTLEFWSKLNEPSTNAELYRARREQLDDLQQNLSLTLANATQSDTAAMAEWKRQIVDLGDKPVGRGAGFPFGVQVMSNLMRWGDYDDQFLNDYGNKLMDTERRLTHNGQTVAWQRMGFDPDLNRTGSDNGPAADTMESEGLRESLCPRKKQQACEGARFMGTSRFKEKNKAEIGFWAITYRDEKAADNAFDPYWDWHKNGLGKPKSLDLGGVGEQRQAALGISNYQSDKRAVAQMRVGAVIMWVSVDASGQTGIDEALVKDLARVFATRADEAQNGKTPKAALGA
ncbi:hypothetical protein [Streptomyces sp. NPDC005408]|uniref:hypothetical protein n=1 Tax=Streptomyces sp. NPDC005408 TaxID=3155341 RepID=UPI0033B16FA8